MRKYDLLEKKYRIAMRDLEQAMKWGTPNEVEKALDHAIKVDFERLRYGKRRRSK